MCAPLKILIRVDASTLIGSGHVMRCLTLAKELRKNDSEVIFVCRDHFGHMKKTINNEGFKCLLLKNPDNNHSRSDEGYLSWLGCSVDFDAIETLYILKKNEIQEMFDWIICDHYALDFEWHKITKKITKKIFVIDDLGNRNHDCELILDQTFLCNEDKYSGKTKISCEKLLGTKYALLGSEYEKLRTKTSLEKRKNIESIETILVFMGGSDSLNWTSGAFNVLNAFLVRNTFDNNLNIKIVVGSQYQFLQQLQSEINQSQLNVNLLVNVSNMAELISTADIAIGAGGGSSWERCSLGLPTLTCVVAENQRELTSQLESAGAIYQWDSEKQLEKRLITIFEDVSLLQKMSNESVNICDGKGTKRVCDIMTKMAS